MPLSTVILVRHASTSASERRRLLGSLDEPLSEAGRREAQALARQLRDVVQQMHGGNRPGRVVTSSLTRARETAACIADALGWPLREASGLAERDFGEWAGRTLSELFVNEALAVERFDREPLGVSPPGAEAVAVLQRRVLHAWAEVTAGDHDDDADVAVIVTHDGPLRILLREIGLADLVAAMPLYCIAPCCAFAFIRACDGQSWQRSTMDLAGVATNRTSHGRRAYASPDALRSRK